MAQAIGVSQPTVSRTIKRLEKEGYIKEYTMIPDFHELGYELMAVTLVKLKRTLSTEEIEKARKISRETLTKGLFEIVMIERGMGLRYTGVVISFHGNYASCVNFKNWLRQFTFLDIDEIESFLISLGGEVHYRSLSFSTLAKHLLMMKEKE